MKHIFHGMKDIDKYVVDKEYIANLYVMRCFFISMVVYCIAFLLNIFNIFIIDKDIMLLGFVPSIFIFLTMFLVTRKVSLSSSKIKYFILFSIVLVFTLIGVTITYHVVIIAVLPILYAILYSSKKVMWYVYGLTVISTIIIVYAGYRHGVCDANMALLTATKLSNYLSGGHFTLTMVNDNTLVSLMLYFVIPRCLIYVSIMAASTNIYKILKSGLEKAEEQTTELRERQKKIQQAYWQTVIALSEAVDAKDRYTSGHSKRVAEYSKMIAERMLKNEREQEMIYRAGLLHDVGKIRIPNNIINKPAKLNDEEYELIKIHPVIGYHILSDISDHSDMALAAKHHHERYDGKGYPNGLVGENIPEMARILAVADSYDAMTSNRSYRKGLPQSVVRSEIEKGKGTQFDPYIAEIMLEMIDEDKEYSLRQIDRTDYKILVVGEDVESNQCVKDILQNESIYDIIVLDTGVEEDIYEKLEASTFEMIIFDINVNKENIWDILQTIKEKYHIPTIIMSDDRGLGNLKEFKELECTDYLAKPFSPLMLSEIIYNVTKKYL